MKWSHYSHLFESERNGWLLYNSASGFFMKIEDDAVDTVKKIQEDPEKYDFSNDPGLYLTLRRSGCIVEDTQDDDFYNIVKMRRLTGNYAVRTLLLTIAVTRSCNFSCSYCYEENRTGKPMSKEVEDKLMDFIDLHKREDQLYITWYGGEPLLAIDRIRSIDRRLKEKEKKYNAMIVTNGYLLKEDIIKDLNDLSINHMQITLDGNKKTHDSRRFQVNGEGSFDMIMNNLDALMASDYKGTVNIRVNIDMRNKDEFRDVYNLINGRYPEDYGKRISVYPGYVKGDGHPDASCFFDSDLTGQFVAELARKDNINAMSLLPQKTAAGCTLTKRCAYVVGPEGELYKCWDDIGIPEMVIGRLDDLTGWNNSLIARGMVGASYLDSPVCRECFYFPVCDGGCHKIRLKNLMDGKNRDCCSYFRDHLDELLEIYYEQKKKAEENKDAEGKKDA
ncbi:MAG: radical SAM protein [Lachnospiraceae bacterium]|nr:radical SAM protein [Lachnospiraceae bacterium]